MKRLILLYSICLISISRLFADEGMWLPLLLEKLNYKDLQNKGLHLSPEDIYSINNACLKDAIVMLNNGDCTGFMVSENGLMMTNHHCAFDYIQKQSNTEHDYTKLGFWANSKYEELKCENLSVSFLVRIEDKTKEILASVPPSTKESERTEIINEAITKIERQSKEENTGYTYNIESFYNGNEYYLFVYQTFNDVRMVGIPPDFIGTYGADTDNWAWPRHTGDFAFLRIYMSPEGKPASYNIRNIPYKSKKHIPISLKGIKNNDFSMVIGYPGSTNRYMTSYGIKNITDKIAPSIVNVRDKRMAILKTDMSDNENTHIKYISKYNHTSNYRKYFYEQKETIIALNIYQKKKTEEEQFQQWLSSNAQMNKKYHQAIPLIKDAYEKIDSLTISRYYYNEIIRRGIDIFSLTKSFSSLYKLLLKNKTDYEAIQKEALSLRYISSNFYNNFQSETDIKLFAALMEMYHKDVSPQQLPSLFIEQVKKYDANFEIFARSVFQKSLFTNQEKLDAFLRKPSAKKLESDPLYALYTAFVNQFEQTNNQYLEATLNLEKGNRLFVAGMIEKDPSSHFYPDANSTMRISFGNITNYTDKNTLNHNYITNIDELASRYIPKDPEFNLSEKYLTLYQSRNFGKYGNNGTLPVCFITNNDVTGGNSGSPVINGDGELIGLVFDINKEASASQIAFNLKYHRAICVDIRYVMWVVDIYAQSNYILNDLDFRYNETKTM